LLHHHIENERFLYKYPFIQYKIIKKNPMIVIIKDGIEIFQEICNQISEITLNNETFKIIEKIIKLKDVDFGLRNTLINYKFLTPYLALNQENYEKYLKASYKEKKIILEKILIGNILSISKSLDYVVFSEIKVNTKLKCIKTKLKDTPFIGFLGQFSVNFSLPDYIGLGKSVSRGFGTIKRIV